MYETIREYVPFYSKLNEKQRFRLENGSQALTFAKGRRVHTANECSGLVFVVKGQLRCTSINEEGRDITLFRLFERDCCLFSAYCMLANLEFDVTVDAAEDTEVILIPAGLARELADENLVVTKFINVILQQRLSDLMWLIDQILNKKIDSRLSALLVEEARITGSTKLTLTHDDAAKHLGSAREVISRALGYLQKEGEVKLTRGSIEILDLDALEERAEASLR